VPVIPADTCQRWREGSSCFRPARELIDTSRLEVIEIDELTAKAFVRTHHYSRRFPAARFRFGLYDRGELAGVAVYSRPFTPAVITNAFPWLADVDEGAELGRFVLLDSIGANGETWFLARCLAALRGRLRAFVSFSDPTARTADDGRQIFPGHIGTIYQASNANYAGTTEPATLRVLPDGTVFSNMSSGKIRRKLSGWRGAVAELERWGAGPLAQDATREDRISWLERWRGELTRPLRHRGLYRYTFTLDRRAPTTYGPARAYPKAAS
jgi:hypothetical protein